MSSCVLDTSAVLALLNQEPGADQVLQAIADGATLSTVNLSEIVGKLAQRGMQQQDIHRVVDGLGIEMADLDAGLAYRIGVLSPLTRPAGLSLGDRACLALAEARGIPAVTADRVWAGLAVGVQIRVIR